LEFIVAFSILEAHLNNTIQMLIGIAAEDKVLLFEQISILRRIEVFEASLNRKLKDPDALAWAKDIVEDLHRVNSHRNHIVHGPWNDFELSTGKATKLKFRGTKRHRVKTYTYTSPQIREMASKIFSIMSRMGFLMGHVLHSDMKLGSPPGNCMPPAP
jgi:hypothetical protein